MCAIHRVTYKTQLCRLYHEINFSQLYWLFEQKWKEYLLDIITNSGIAQSPTASGIMRYVFRQRWFMKSFVDPTAVNSHHSCLAHDILVQTIIRDFKKRNHVPSAGNMMPNYDFRR